MNIVKKSYTFLNRAGAHSKYLILIVMVYACCVWAKDASVPSWIDTVAPTVSIAPVNKFHTSLITITLSANKIASLFLCVNSKSNFEMYRRPITLTQDGTYTVYFYGVDDFGNKSRIDSMVYVLDSKYPQISRVPESGKFKSAVLVRFFSDEPVTFALSPDSNASHGTIISDSVMVTDSLVGYLVARDKAGNTTLSSFFRYLVDTTTVRVSVTPANGSWNTPQKISLSAKQGIAIRYTFDESALPEKFLPVLKSLFMPYGKVTLRYYGISASGIMSDIGVAVYHIDTIAPRIKLTVEEGPEFDSLFISCNEPSTIYYTLDKTFPIVGSSRNYSGPIPILRRKKVMLRALALDQVKNRSDVFVWEKTYETIPPRLTVSAINGLYNRPFEVVITSDKKADIYYTLSGDSVTPKALKYRGPLSISRDGLTQLRTRAQDDAENWSNEIVREYTIDTRPPYVKVSVDLGSKNGEYLVSLAPDESSFVYYVIGEKNVSTSSLVYRQPILMHGGEVLYYFSVDMAGNRSIVQTMEDLKSPVISATPGGGVFNRRVRVGFFANMPGEIYWRTSLDTTWKRFTDSILIDNEGVTTLEYFLKSQQGTQSPNRRNEYVLDWTAPQAFVNYRKGSGDSVSVFFTFTEKSTLYYTADGTDPRSSQTAKIAGNVYSGLSERISVLRSEKTTVSYLLEDEKGNASRVFQIDLARPRAVPDMPSGSDRIYKKPISITLNTIDDRSTIFYAHHGKIPTIDSMQFTNPITLTTSDTIVTLVLDASGFLGPLDTLMYTIVLPMTPRFTWQPDTPSVGVPLLVDASSSLTRSSDTTGVQFRWNFDGDSIFEQPFSSKVTTTLQFSKGGYYRASLQIRDKNGDTTSADRVVYVREVCPGGMVFIPDSGSRSFCIDTYEWPNQKTVLPLTAASWIEANVYCMNIGKRLCNANEWTTACKSGQLTSYPYGSTYNPKICATNTKKITPSGKMPHCVNEYGVYDMVGNAWEWVSDQAGDYPQMMGGDISSGKNAQCTAKSNGSVVARSKTVGFRCCQ